MMCGDCLTKNRVPMMKRVCVKHAGVEALRILCVGDSCACFVCVPIRKGKDGGAESHVWLGCKDVLRDLVYYAKAANMSLDDLLSANR